MVAKWKPRKMKIRLVSPEEAEACWNIRNLSIRQGCQTSYSRGPHGLDAGRDAGRLPSGDKGKPLLCR